MSYFLIYFEKNNPNASWMEFQRDQESIPETFAKANDSKSLLRIENAKISLDGKIIGSFIIHDGVSSDRIIESNFKKDPVVTQRSVVLNFLENRLAKSSSEHYFIFHLYEKTIYEVETIEYDGIVEVGMSDIKNLPNSVRRNFLYKLI